MATGKPTKPVVSELVQATIGKLMNRYQAAVRAVAEDNDPDTLDVDTLTGMMHDYSDGAAANIGTELVNDAIRGGRAQGLQQAASAAGVDPVWRRSSVMEDYTCGSCAAADGSRISGPSADLGSIHEGPPSTCLCLPYADLHENA